MTLVEKARQFATLAHEGQVRKYTGQPYIVHPEEVAGIVSTVPHTEAMLAAAFLHDVVEDTGTPISRIETEFGTDVAELVGWLTDVSTPADGSRKARKLRDRLHSAAAPAAAQTIKLADLISNIRTVAQGDPSFAPVYMAEKRDLLELLTEGDPTLHAEALRMVTEYFKAPV